jgi:signal transduction histidine kinase/CheY-like chemotaxis protein
MKSNTPKQTLEDILPKSDDRLYRAIKALFQENVASDYISLFTYDTTNNSLNLKLFYDKNIDSAELIEEDKNPLFMSRPKGCIGKSVLNKTPTIHNYLTSDKDYDVEYDNPSRLKLRSQILFPIIENKELLGVIRFCATTKSNIKKYSSKDITSLNAHLSHLIEFINTLLSNNKTNTAITYQEDSSSSLEQNGKNSINDNSLLLFLSNTVHDIRTPANSLYGFLELLEEQIDDKRLKSFVTNAKDSASFINTLTNNILEAAKNRYNETQEEKTKVDTIPFLSDIINSFAANMLEKKIHYFITISPDIPKSIEIDRLKLKRVLTNLIGNAYKFTPQKRHIYVDIKWDNSNQSATFSIKDTGIGIDEKDQKKLFKSFTQAHNDIQKEYGGSGLGLSISANYISSLGGELKFNSIINEGSEFYFTIPLNVVDQAFSYEKFDTSNINITILTHYPDAKYPKFIHNLLVSFGVPKESIHRSDKIIDNSTHVISFEEKIDDTLLEAAKSGEFKLLLIEQKLFSLLKNEKLKEHLITSKNIYNGNTIHNLIYREKRLKVVVVDDNKINVTLLEFVLSDNNIDIHSFTDPKEALVYLKECNKPENRVDALFLDNYMDVMSGNELIEKYRNYEKRHNLEPITAISVSGDPQANLENNEFYDFFIQKPFNKKHIKEIIKSIDNKQSKTKERG